eukprot:SAG22_NODE_484_length_9912_cov_23.425150_7_plen_194_part_00
MTAVGCAWFFVFAVLCCAVPCRHAGASLLVGPLADMVGPRVIFWICIPLAAQIILPSLWGWLPEKKLSREERGLNTAIIHHQPRLFVLALAMAVAALGMALINLFGTRLSQSIYAGVAAISLCVLGFVCLDKGLAKANLYMFMTNALYISTDGALDFFYTAEEVTARRPCRRRSLGGPVACPVSWLILRSSAS